MSDRKANGKSMTLDEIAKLAGTTKSTVSRVLSNHPRISEATRQRVMEIVEANQYQPNLLAQGLARGSTGLIGVLSSNIGSGFYAEVIRGIDMVFTEQKHHLLCSFAHTVEDYVELLREMCLGGQVEGLVVLAPYPELFERPFSSNVPVVLCAAKPLTYVKGWSDLDSVTLNNAKAMESLVEHLVQEGHRSIIHLAGPEDNYDAFERREAFVRAVDKHVDVQAQVLPCGLIREDGQHAAAAYLEKNGFLADAFVAMNDSTATGFLQILREHYPRNRWPAAVTGWDDTPVAQVTDMTSVSMPTTEMGQECARLLTARIAETGRPGTETHEVVDMEVQVRQSSLRNIR